MPNTIEVQQAPTIQYQTSPNQQPYQQIVIHNYQQNPQVLVSVKECGILSSYCKSQRNH